MNSFDPTLDKSPGDSRSPIPDLATLLLLGLAFWLFHLNSRGLWEDEFYTLGAVRQPIDELINNRLSAGHFPTYFLFLKAWTQLVGFSEWMMRLPSVLLALGTLPFVYGFCRRAWGRETALWAGVFTILHQRILWSAQEARPYALMLLAAAASMYFLYRALDRKPNERSSAGWAVAWGLATLLGLFTHASFLFLFVGQVAMVIWVMARRKRMDWPLTAGALVSLGIGVSGLVWLGAHRENRYASEPQFLAFKKLADHLGELFVGRASIIMGSSMKYVFTALLVAMLVVLWRRRRTEPLARAPLAFGLALNWLIALPFIIYAYSASVSMIARYGRYYTPAVGAVPILLALLVVSTPRRRYRNLLAGLGVGLLALVSFGYHGFAQDRIREGVAYLNEHREASEPVYFVTHHSMELVTSYYPLAGDYRIVDTGERDAELLRARFAEELPRETRRFWLCFYQEHKHPLRKNLASWFGSNFTVTQTVTEDDLRYIEIYRLDRIIP